MNVKVEKMYCEGFPLSDHCWMTDQHFKLPHISMYLFIFFRISQRSVSPGGQSVTLSDVLKNETI